MLVFEGRAKPKYRRKVLSEQPRTQACSRYPSGQRRLGTERDSLGEFSRQAWQVTSHPKSPRTTGNEAALGAKERINNELTSARPQRKRMRNIESNIMEIFRFMGWTLRLCCIEVVHFPIHSISFYLVILKSTCVSHCACVSGLWSWNTAVLYPYSDKMLCSSPPSVDFFASDMPTRKNQHWRGRPLLSQLMW